MRWVHGRSGRASCRAWTARHGVGTAPEGPDGVGARRADHREPREGLVGERDPPAAVREARAPVVAGRVPGEQAQLPDLGLEGVGAHHPVDPLDEPDHLLDARPLVAAGEVGAHASSQVAAGADVEHLVAGPAEQVDARLLGDGVGQVALGALDRADLDLQRQEVLERRHAAAADALEQPVQDVDGGPRVVQRAVDRARARPEERRQGREPARRRLVAGQDAAPEPRRAHHRRARPRRAVTPARRAQVPDVERRVVGHEHRPGAELQQARAGPRAAAGRPGPSPS